MDQSINQLPGSKILFAMEKIVLRRVKKGLQDMMKHLEILVRN